MYSIFSFMLHFTGIHELIPRNEADFHENLVCVALRSGVPMAFHITGADCKKLFRRDSFRKALMKPVKVALHVFNCLSTFYE